ncbi:MAG: branched-chain amino acid ABC transporter permease [Gammaproteobacteria bacterium]|nr:branched-chain amino acid ABC transporter permease [Gammaproteobacteria bacterium]
MSLEILLQSLISGLLLGLVYALVAIGLSMIFGVMDIVNFAHGEFLMLGMYVAFWGFSLWALDPILSIPISFILLFLLGILIYKLIIVRILHTNMVAQIFATFGLMILLRGIAQYLWKADFRTIENSYATGTLQFLGMHLGKPQIFAGLGAVIMTGGVYYFLNHTKWGVALEATAQDKEAAQLMGIDSHKMFALAWGIAAASAGVAGTLIATFFPIFPEVGASFILIAFVVVNLGGFGSVVGAFWAGLCVGVVEVLGGLLLAPSYKLAVVLVLFLVLLMWRPQGLLGKS